MSESLSRNGSQQIETITVFPSAIEALKERANKLHERVEEAATEVLKSAKKAGEALIKAKALVGHGEWLSWLEENFKGSATNAQNYMRVAKHWDELQKHNGVAGLSLRAALAQLAAPKTEQELLEKIPLEEQKLVVDLAKELHGKDPDPYAIRKVAAIANSLYNSGALEDDRGEQTPWESLTGVEKKQALARAYNKRYKNPPERITIHKKEHDRHLEILRMIDEYLKTRDEEKLEYIQRLVDEHKGQYGGAS